MPSVICFYSQETVKTKNLAFTENFIRGVCVNKSKLFTHGEKLDLDKTYPDEKNNLIKNASMKLVRELMHESFGHVKFKLHSDSFGIEKSDTPRKCFDNKILKKLVPISDVDGKNNINALSDGERSDSGNYYECSYGKLSGTEFYTFTLLKKLNDINKLIDVPELFYKNENLEKLQKYVYFKYFYENKMDKENENVKLLDFPTLDKELEFLTNFFENTPDKSL